MTLSTPRPRLENWSFVTRQTSPYQAPESADTGLIGEVYDDERYDPEIDDEFKDGHRIITTGVRYLNLKSGFATTRNTTYLLGKIDPKFSQWIEENGYTLEQYERVINDKHKDSCS